MSESQENIKHTIENDDEQREADSKDVVALINRGLVHANLGDHRLAIREYSAAIRYAPNSADAFHNRGNAYVHLGKLRKGIADLTRAINIDPSSAVSHASRGVAWRRKGNYANALADYERALVLDSSNVDRCAGLAELLAICPDSRYRDGSRALELATDACERTGYNHVEYLGSLAAAHAEQGDFESAISIQTKALDLATEENDIDDMKRYIECYAAGIPCRIGPTTWRQRWS